MKVEKKEEKGRKKTKGTRSRGIVIKKNGNGKQINMILENFSSWAWGGKICGTIYTPANYSNTKKTTLYSLNAFIIVGYIYNIT